MHELRAMCLEFSMKACFEYRLLGIPGEMELLDVTTDYGTVVQSPFS